jgi:hypothetical protein
LVVRRLDEPRAAWDDGDTGGWCLCTDMQHHDV